MRGKKLALKRAKYVEFFFSECDYFFFEVFFSAMVLFFSHDFFFSLDCFFSLAPLFFFLAIFFSLRWFFFSRYIPLKVKVSGVNGYSTTFSSLTPTQIVAFIKCAGKSDSSASRSCFVFHQPR